MKKTISFEINEESVERLEGVVGLDHETAGRIYTEVQKDVLSGANMDKVLVNVLKTYKGSECIIALYFLGTFGYDNYLKKKAAGLI